MTPKRYRRCHNSEDYWLCAYALKQHYQIGYCNGIVGPVCFLWSTNWTLEYLISTSGFKGLRNVRTCMKTLYQNKATLICRISNGSLVWKLWAILWVSVSYNYLWAINITLVYLHKLHRCRILDQLHVGSVRIQEFILQRLFLYEMFINCI
jgi:hypothetical protein